MNKLEFPRVNLVGPRNYESRELSTVVAALAFMTEHRPGETGPKRQVALDALTLAIAGNASADDARAAFVYAADGAGILAPVE
ncbi:DUF982 domain-containing protein [Phyllobacterium endophyticum]|uniref:DUF982 domain-containing protein n=1 Tax=Phyllobacterium endophyticum TaxID=1149773 RepID=A0A2P7AR71_9HYPH|nr:DUF982 domain-containing protein [Phyllobacterium endophyticum]MBB3237376.1 hypothetical protein [Phyllobacterium endophyticum]PSH56725.1 DUF982 domain-containing protein [Phyllobacterium endophyticum]TYR44291.1 DUF982 domain-containing protein [Phyllobacterium endophyticum]